MTSSLPFSFLDISELTPEIVRNHLILIAFQMLKTRTPNGAAEVEFGNISWMVYVKTDFVVSSISSLLSGTLFKGEGGIKEGENNLLSPFKASFLLDPGRMGRGLLDVSMDNPDQFLDFCKRNYGWFPVMLSE